MFGSNVVPEPPLGFFEDSLQLSQLFKTGDASDSKSHYFSRQSRIPEKSRNAQQTLASGFRPKQHFSRVESEPRSSNQFVPPPPQSQSDLKLTQIFGEQENGDDNFHLSQLFSNNNTDSQAHIVTNSLNDQRTSILRDISNSSFSRLNFPSSVEQSENRKYSQPLIRDSNICSDKSLMKDSSTSNSNFNFVKPAISLGGMSAASQNGKKRLSSSISTNLTSAKSKRSSNFGLGEVTRYSYRDPEVPTNTDLSGSTSVDDGDLEIEDEFDNFPDEVPDYTRTPAGPVMTVDHLGDTPLSLPGLLSSILKRKFVKMFFFFAHVSQET